MLDFDNAVLDFWEWFEAKQDEEIIGQDRSPKLKKGQAMVKKYRTLDAIWERYGKQDAPVPSVTELRQKQAEDEAAIMDFWLDDE